MPAKAGGLRLRRGAKPFSVRTGVPGKPGSFAPPILFLLEKKNASRSVEEKDAWAAAFQTPPETPFFAFYGSY